jgi:hypothetical protein
MFDFFPDHLCLFLYAKQILQDFPMIVSTFDGLLLEIVMRLF